MSDVIERIMCEVYNRNRQRQNMKSKGLLEQLGREQHPRTLLPYKEHIEELYVQLSKTESKCVHLPQFLCYLIEKDVVRNMLPLDSLSKEDKLSRVEFQSALVGVARRLYSADEHPLDTLLREKILQGEERNKLDDCLRKYLTRDTVLALAHHAVQLQSLYEAYLPENYNQGLGFTWEELRLLDKKLPIVCLLRMLCDADLCPQTLSLALFVDTLTKVKPFHYSADYLATYLKESYAGIKLLDNDQGLSFLQLQFVLLRFGVELYKESRGDGAVQRIMKGLFEKENGKLQQSIHNVRGKQKVVKRINKMESLYDARDEEMKLQNSKRVFKNMVVTQVELQHIKRGLDDELAELPQKKVVEKQNEGYFSVDDRHIVIGQQLPKVQQKAKQAVKEGKKKQQDELMGYKEEVPVVKEQMVVVKKQRVTNEYPIILNQVLYPGTLKTEIAMTARAESYLQASYINLGQRLYEDAFVHYTKVKELMEVKNPSLQYFFLMHSAQIFQAAGRDEVALSLYNKAKDCSANLPSSEQEGRALPYIGIGACLYHLEEYEYAFRCFEKARTGVSIEAVTVTNAVLQNNVACCLMMLGRNREAAPFFITSAKILDLLSGKFDQKTLIVEQNGVKNRKAHIQMEPQFSTMWKTYVQKKPLAKNKVNVKGKK